jgi:hypothetical protein
MTDDSAKSNLHWSLLAVVVIVVAYFASAELTKRWFYRERGASAKQL